jgi:hypothetical protein
VSRRAHNCGAASSRRLHGCGCSTESDALAIAGLRVCSGCMDASATLSQWSPSPPPASMTWVARQRVLGGAIVAKRFRCRMSARDRGKGSTECQIRHPQPRWCSANSAVQRLPSGPPLRQACGALRPCLYVCGVSAQQRGSRGASLAVTRAAAVVWRTDIASRVCTAGGRGRPAPRPLWWPSEIDRARCQ